MDNDHYELPNSFQMLMKQIGQRPLLTVDQEQTLARAMQTGDIKAYHELVEANIGLAISIAKSYRWFGLPYEDLIQEAICGLMTGIRKFDPEKGIRLSTYATYWIKQAILRALDWNGLIHIPEYFQEKVQRFSDQLRDLRVELEKMPTLSQIVLNLGLDEETVQAMLVAMWSIRSGKPLFLDPGLKEDWESLIDVIPDDAPTPEQAIIQLATTETIHSALGCLPDRDQEIIKLLYGINKEYPHTRDEVGRLMKLTRKQVKQIETRALRKLRRPLKGIKYNR